jgi:ADP-dependent NAD(P)H-hydrate dehydratase / NAD(P)H-hydrate epimerase
MSYSPVYLTSDIRAIEVAAQAAPDAPRLMERAGLAAAEYARKVMNERARSVLVVAGPGNNGGDAFEVAVHLKRWFFRVEVLFTGDRGKLSADACGALAKWQAAGGALLSEYPDPVQSSRGVDFIVDGLFGIGLVRALEGDYALLIEKINRSGVPILALDLPSGINADTGAVMGTAVRAAHTVTFIALKPGLLTLDGPDHCGTLDVNTLQLDCEALKCAQGRLLSGETLVHALAPRPRNFHKGQAGNVVVLGGANGMVGAALLAGRAALKCGAGRVYVGLLDDNDPQVDNVQPELMLRRRDEVPLDDAVIASGPGLGQSAEAGALLRRSLGLPAPLVLDADALNMIAADPALASAVRNRTAGTVMTPHPAEAARLLGASTREIQADRIAAACSLAVRYGAFVALKGNGTVIAAPEGEWWINPSGHPGMASAGMGDALTGMIASLIAQGATPLAALLAAVWLHGAAGDAVAARNQGPLGTIASDVIDQARLLLNRDLATRH